MEVAIALVVLNWKLSVLNSLTYMSVQDTTSPYNINTTSSRKVIRRKKISVRGLGVDFISNSSNEHHKNSMADRKENY